MGKATRWLKGLLGMKKERKNTDSSSSTVYSGKSENKRWSFWRRPAACRGSNVVPIDVDQVKGSATLVSSLSNSEREDNQRTVEAATAAAVTVVNKFRTGQGRKWFAALKIQTVYRGHLARRALRALKGLVKFQALVRGYLVRKRAATTLKVIQTLIKVQTKVRIQRSRQARRNINQQQPGSGTRKSPGPDRTLWQVTKMAEIGTCTPRDRMCSRKPATVLSEHEKDRRRLGWLQLSLDGVDCCCSTAHHMHSNVHVGSAKRGYGDGLESCRNYMATTTSFNLKLRSPYCRS